MVILKWVVLIPVSFRGLLLFVTCGVNSVPFLELRLPWWLTPNVHGREWYSNPWMDEFISPLSFILPLFSLGGL